MTEQLKPLTEAETAELLDWVSACQSSYHIDSTPGHRFGGLGSHLQENRDSLVEYVNALIAARAQPAQAVPVLTDAEIEDACWTEMDRRLLSFARAVEAAVRAKLGVAVPSDVVRDAERYRWLRNESWAGYNTGKGTPSVYTVDGAGNRRMMLAEEAMDAAIDAAIAAQGEKP